MPVKSWKVSHYHKWKTKSTKFTSECTSATYCSYHAVLAYVPLEQNNEDLQLTNYTAPLVFWQFVFLGGTQVEGQESTATHVGRLPRPLLPPFAWPPLKCLLSIFVKMILLCREFLAPGAPSEINIDGKTMEKTLLDLKTPSRFVQLSVWQLTQTELRWSQHCARQQRLLFTPVILFCLVTGSHSTQLNTTFTHWWRKTAMHDSFAQINTRIYSLVPSILFPKRSKFSCQLGSTGHGCGLVLSAGVFVFPHRRHDENAKIFGLLTLRDVFKW